MSRKRYDPLLTMPGRKRGMDEYSKIASADLGGIWNRMRERSELVSALQKTLWDVIRLYNHRAPHADTQFVVSVLEIFGGLAAAADQRIRGVEAGWSPDSSIRRELWQELRAGFRQISEEAVRRKEWLTIDGLLVILRAAVQLRLHSSAVEALVQIVIERWVQASQDFEESVFRRGFMYLAALGAEDPRLVELFLRFHEHHGLPLDPMEVCGIWRALAWMGNRPALERFSCEHTVRLYQLLTEVEAPGVFLSLFQLWTFAKAKRTAPLEVRREMALAWKEANRHEITLFEREVLAELQKFRRALRSIEPNAVTELGFEVDFLLITREGKRLAVEADGIFNHFLLGRCGNVRRPEDILRERMLLEDEGLPVVRVVLSSEWRDPFRRSAIVRDIVLPAIACRA